MAFQSRGRKGVRSGQGNSAKSLAPSEIQSRRDYRGREAEKLPDSIDRNWDQGGFHYFFSDFLLPILHDFFLSSQVPVSGVLFRNSQIVAQQNVSRRLRGASWLRKWFKQSRQKPAQEYRVDYAPASRFLLLSNVQEGGDFEEI